MSKLIEILKQTDAPPVPIGFRRVQDSAPKPKIRLIAAPGSAGESPAGADALFIIASAADAPEAIRRVVKAASVPCGAWLSSPDRADTESLVQAGADFVVFPPEAPVIVGAIGKILEVNPSIETGLLSAANRLDVEALFLTGLEKGPLTWRSLLVIQRFADLLAKPLLVAVPAGAGKDELRLLWNAGVDGIVAESGIEELRSLIDALVFPLPRRRARTEALLPRLSPSRMEEREEEEDEDEDEEP